MRTALIPIALRTGPSVIRSLPTPPLFFSAMPHSSPSIGVLKAAARFIPGPPFLPEVQTNFVSPLTYPCSSPLEVLATKQPHSTLTWTPFHRTASPNGSGAPFAAPNSTCHFGVKSSAREAWQHHDEVLIAEAACASLNADMQTFSITPVLPRVARVRPTDELLPLFA